MNILGPDTLTFGVDDIVACRQYLIDYGLTQVNTSSSFERFEALDGTAIEIAKTNDSTLPPRLESANTLRKTTYGVADAATLNAIQKELSSDRPVTVLPDGALETVDDMSFTLGFQITRRKTLSVPTEPINTPGAQPQRAMNALGASDSADLSPLSLSHVVYFVPDEIKARAFYTDRLGFFITDILNGAGAFLRPAGTTDHHTLFQIQTPPHMQGCEHFTFHMQGPTSLMQAGTQFVNKGHESFWGPGRHYFGSNWFWYFNSPLGCHVEYDADMDIHDDTWIARDVAMSADASQLFLFKPAEKWAPGGDPH